MIYGYVRVSTRSQSLVRQIMNIRHEYPSSIIVQESYTGTTMDRPAWSKLYNKLKPGDVVVFDSVSRMARNAEEGFRTYEELYSKDIDLIFLKEPGINTMTYKKALQSSIPLTNTNVDYILEGINKYLLALAREQIILAFEFCEKELNAIHQRTKESLVIARLNGKTLGHRKNTPLITKKSIEAKKLILRCSKDFGGNLSDADCIKLCGCSKKTYYKYKNELKSSKS